MSLRRPSPASVAPVAYQGSADLEFGFRHGRTCLVRSLVRPPFVVQRAFYLDSLLEDMAFVFLANPTAGIFQGDFQGISIVVGPGARAHVTNQSATKVHTMPESYASQETDLSVEDNAYLEYLPEPLIPFKGARLRQSTRISVAPGGALLFGEVTAPGRVARGEVLAYDYLESRMTVCRPNGIPIYHESYRLEPRARDPRSPVILGSAAAPTLGSLLIVTDSVDARGMAAQLGQCARSETDNYPQVSVGTTCLPGDSGVGVKVLGSETQPVKAVLTHLASEARRLITGAPLPLSRKY